MTLIVTWIGTVTALRVNSAAWVASLAVVLLAGATACSEPQVAVQEESAAESLAPAECDDINAVLREARSVVANPGEGIEDYNISGSRIAESEALGLIQDYMAFLWPKASDDDLKDIMKSIASGQHDRSNYLAVQSICGSPWIPDWLF